MNFLKLQKALNEEWYNLSLFLIILFFIFILLVDLIVMVKKITKEVGGETIQAYIEDNRYYLKFYSTKLDTKTLDVLKNRSIARDKFLDYLIEKSEGWINYQWKAPSFTFFVV